MQRRKDYHTCNNNITILCCVCAVCVCAVCVCSVCVSSVCVCVCPLRFLPIFMSDLLRTGPSDGSSSSWMF